jgi:hypothetical protein
MQYLFTYAENDSRRSSSGAPSWRIRQVCVFHRYNPSGAGNLWIILHACPRSKLQRQIEQMVSTSPNAVLTEWSSMHLLVLSTYLGGWRWCIRNLGDEIEQTVRCCAHNTLDDNDKDRVLTLALLARLISHSHWISQSPRRETTRTDSSSSSNSSTWAIDLCPSLPDYALHCTHCVSLRR